MPYLLVLSPDHVVLIGRTLDELPHKHVAGLMKEIQTQISEQDAEMKTAQETGEPLADALIRPARERLEAAYPPQSCDKGA